MITAIIEDQGLTPNKAIGMAIEETYHEFKDEAWAVREEISKCIWDFIEENKGDFDKVP